MDYFNFLMTGVWTVIRLFLSLWWIWLPWYLWRLALDTQRYSLGVKVMRETQWVLLEVKLPREILKTPEAMDRVFAALHGPHDPPKTFKDKYIEPKVRLWWNFEIELTNGDMRFYCYMPKGWRGTFEASIYAQYPDVTISEAEDYTKNLPEEVPGPEYDLWGMEVNLLKPNPYPILTYRDFKALSDPGIDVEEVKVDPLSSFAEIATILNPGERIWYQLLVRPVGQPATIANGGGATDEWVEEGIKIVDKLASREKPKSPSMFQAIGEIVTALLEEIPEHAAELANPGSSSPEAGLGRLGKAPPKPEKKDPPSLMMHATPGEKEVIEGIERKIGKLGFDAVIRMIYVAPRGQLNRGRIATMFSILRQYNTQNLNSFRQNTNAMTIGKDYFGGLYTSRVYLERIKKGLMYWYRHRSIYWDNKNILGFLYIPETWQIAQVLSGLFYRLFPNTIETMKSKPIVLNTEELASIYHFPGRTVSSPTMSRMEAKQGEPPVNLPT